MERTEYRRSEYIRPERRRPRRRRRGAGTVIGRILCVLLVTVLLLAAFLYGVMFILCKGPSETARDLFVLSVRETSAIGFLANLYFSDEEIAQIEAAQEEGPIEMDASLIEIASRDSEDASGADEWGYTDEDGDGLILVPIAGESYTGYMLIVLDPSRVTLGFSPEDMGWRGFTVEEFAKKFGAVAAINGGGFEDPNGFGDGSTPEHLVVKNGVIYNGGNGIGAGFVGFDENHILHVGLNSVEDLQNNNIQEGCGYGPILVVNNELASGAYMPSGLNPRTAIGQRSDGAVLMLVIDGRRATSLGASYRDIAEIMLQFGAVNAGNLDGGSSSLMWLNGDYVNNKAAVIGIRPIPTSFLVMP